MRANASLLVDNPKAETRKTCVEGGNGIGEAGLAHGRGRHHFNIDLPGAGRVGPE